MPPYFPPIRILQHLNQNLVIFGGFIGHQSSLINQHQSSPQIGSFHFNCWLFFPEYLMLERNSMI